MDVVRLEQLKRGLLETHAKLNKLEDILPHIDPGDVATEIEASERINDELFAAMAKVEHVLASIAHAPSAGGSLPSATVPTVNPTNRTKLPKLTLKPFNGNLTGWSPLWDMYKVAVHDNVHLSNIEKFSYLQSLLVGKAQEAIAGMPLTDANYTAAVDLLQRRFGDKERIIAAHMDTLMSLEPVVSEHHLIELRRLYDKTESSIRSLDALGGKPEAYGALLIPVFVKKLPSELRLIITRRVPTDEWQLTKIIEVFLEELEARGLMCIRINLSFSLNVVESPLR